MARKLQRHGLVGLHILPELEAPTFKHPTKGEKYRMLQGVSVKMHSQRYAVFQKTCSCVVCGIEGEYFAIEKSWDSKVHYHLNLYALDKDGKEVLMTKDHIIPKSKGGPNTIDNYQTMCEHCNMAKGANDKDELNLKLEKLRSQIFKKLKEAKYIKKQLAAIP